MRVAAVTMVYNEREYLPVWLRHYAAQVGADHCFVIDHGSTDGSTEALGRASRIRLPRSPHDDARRALFMADFCGGLLRYYDAVILTDVDELAVTNAPSLAGYAASAPPVTTAIGINLLHLPEEPALDFAGPVGMQRRWGWFVSALCKPALIRRRVTWSPGFHSADGSVAFGGLYLFHLRYADRAAALARLGRTREMDWADRTAGAHQRWDDATLIEMLDRWAKMDRIAASFDPSQPPLVGCLDQVLQSQTGRTDEMYRIALDIENYQLWRVPGHLAAKIG